MLIIDISLSTLYRVYFLFWSSGIRVGVRQVNGKLTTISSAGVCLGHFFFLFLGFYESFCCHGDRIFNRTAVSNAWVKARTDVCFRGLGFEKTKDGSVLRLGTLLKCFREGLFCGMGDEVPPSRFSLLLFIFEFTSRLTGVLGFWGDRKSVV